MRETIFQYKIFDEEYESKISELTSVFQTSDCNQFKGKIQYAQKGNETRIRPCFHWVGNLRPPVGFFFQTIQIGIEELLFQEENLKLFQHGYQSWSFSASYSAEQKDISPSLEFLRYSQENIYSHHTEEPGEFLSEGFICLYSEESDSGIILGLEKIADPGAKIKAILDRNGKLTHLSLILDFYSSPEWKSGGKISIPDFTYRKFNGTPEKHLLQYFEDYAKNVKLPEMPKKVPTGWCSWYYYYTKISEKIILDNLKVVKEKSLPIQFFQVDDGYQKSIGDWLVTNDRFPAGMKIIADEIKREGYQPGIWLAPFLVRKESEFFQKYPEAVLKDENGDPVPALWNPLWGTDYTYCIDLTHPKSKDFLVNVFKTITKDWGYPYLKLDFLYAGLLPGQVFDPGMTPQVRYQTALGLIRKTVGKDVFLLGCGAPIFPSIGFFQGMRISCDVAPFWGAEIKRKIVKDKNALCTEKALINDITRASMHRNFWLNDPDCLLVRKKKNSMKYNQTLLMASVMAISGGMLLVSDDLTKLEPERWDLLLKAFELSKLCQGKTPIPIGLFTDTFPPALYNPSGFLGVWNPKPKPSRVRLRLPFSPKVDEWRDFWTDGVEESAVFQDGYLELELEGFGSRVFPLK